MNVNPERSTLIRFGPVLMAPLIMLAGCQALFFFTNPDASETHEAEYGKIGSRKIAIVVWTDQSTIDVYPNARSEVCRAVTYHLKDNLKQASFVSHRDIDEFMQENWKTWEGMSHAEICKHLDCNMVLRVDMQEFTTRASETRQLRKARLGATINLYDGEAGGGMDAVYEDEIKITYPPGSIHGVQDLDETDLLHGAINHFAEMAARKFYNHEIKLRNKRKDW